MKSFLRAVPGVLLLAGLVTWAAGPQEELWEAARQGNLAQVRALVESGVDVNAATRYGATALFFAADKGHLDIVRFLLEKGADPNRQDSFYGATPLTWALSNGHLELAKMLLKQGATGGGGQALLVGVRARDPELVELALAAGGVTAQTLQGARTQAEQRGPAEIARVLNNFQLPPTGPVSVSREVLNSYTGKYLDDNEKESVEISLSDETLQIKNTSGASRLVSVSSTTFRGEEEPDLTVTFGGRGGVVERVIVNSGQGVSVFFPAREKARAETADESAGKIRAFRGGRFWPSFRGPRASGVSDNQNLPISWNLETGTHIRWRTAVPGISNASPVIWGDRVFVVTAISGSGDKTFRTGLYGDVKPVDDLSPHQWSVYALDAQTGKTVWERTAAEGVPGSKRHFKASQANSTPATDGKHVVVLFGSTGGLYCYDFAGNLLWKKDLGVLDSGWFYDPSYQWGHSSSPIIYEDKVIVQADIQKDSYIAAFDVESGRQVWRTPRDEIPTWGTPTVFEGEWGAELITNGTKIRGYDPQNGQLLWRLEPNSEITVATPVVTDRLAFVTAGYPPVRPIYALKPGGRGDLSAADGSSSNRAVAWSLSRGGTYIPTPIVYDGRLYLLANNGRLSCYDAASGKRIFRARVGSGGSFSASPVASDGKLFITSESGDVYVVAAGDRYQLLAENQVGAVVMATPAISGQQIVFRTLDQVLAVGR